MGWFNRKWLCSSNNSMCSYLTEKQHQLVTQNALYQQRLSFARSILAHSRKTLHESSKISVEHAWLACEQALCLGKGWKNCEEREGRGWEPGDKHLGRYSTLFLFKQRAYSQANAWHIGSVIFTSFLITVARTQWAHNQPQVRALERGEQDWLLQKCGLCRLERFFSSSLKKKNVNSNKNWPKKIKVNIDSAYQPWFRVHLCLGTVATSKLTSRILCSITRWTSMAFIYAPWSCRRSHVPSNGVPWIMSHVVPPTPRIIATIFRYNDKNSTDSLKSN